MSPLFAWTLLLASTLSCVVTSPLQNRAFTGDEKRWGNATYVTSISQCPPLPPRSSPPTTVHDLRPDDFSYTMAIGDSITAGAYLRGSHINPDLSVSEWRGQSYAAGMDDGAVTIPNFIKHYNSAATGGSIGSNNFLEICLGLLCPPGSIGWNEKVDQLNAARTGAMASNLPHEVNDYLVPQLAKRNIPREKFKYLNFQIGSNDLCWFCAQTKIDFGPGSPDHFEANIRETLEALRAAIPNTLVNLIAVFKFSNIYETTLKDPHCTTPYTSFGCPCLMGGKIGAVSRKQMDELADKYNNRLLKIVREYQVANYPDFAVVWQPPVVTLGSYPIQALSNYECFHPSLKSHELVASGLWNRMVAPAEEKAVVIPWSTTPEIRCLQEDDRISTKNLL